MKLKRDPATERFVRRACSSQLVDSAGTTVFRAPSLELLLGLEVGWARLF